MQAVGAWHARPLPFRSKETSLIQQLHPLLILMSAFPGNISGQRMSDEKRNIFAERNLKFRVVKNVVNLVTLTKWSAFHRIPSFLINTGYRPDNRSFLCLHFS